MNSTIGTTLSTLVNSTQSLRIPDNLFAPTIEIGHRLARTWVSLIGIVMVIGGVWYADWKWDEMGSAAYRKAEAKRDESGSSAEVVIPEDELDAAFTFPFVFVLGWIVIAASYLVDAGILEGSLSPFPVANVVCAVFSLIIGVVASVPMADAVRARKPKKKKILSLIFVGSWIGLSIATAWIKTDSLFTNFGEFREDFRGGLSLALCLIGAIMIIVSMRILWMFRKMGDTWEREGKPNKKFALYQPGGPLFVLGFFLFWLGINNISEAGTRTYVPINGGRSALFIFLNLRTLIAFFCGCGMVPVVMMVDYAHDEGSPFVGFGTSGKFFGRYFESPIPFFVAWTFFGFSGFIAPDNSLRFFWMEPRTWVVLVTCIIQSIVAGYLIQTALYKGNMAAKTKFSIVFVLLFLLLAIMLGFTTDFQELSAGGWGLGFGLLGALLVILGQKTSFGHRKRGDHFMMEGEPNPNPIVYSPGQPLFMTGWILLSWAMSMHY